MSYFAEYEAKKISRRTKAGLERAQQEGKDISAHQVRPVQGPAQGDAGGGVFEGRDEEANRPRIQHSQEVSEAYSRR